MKMIIDECYISRLKNKFFKILPLFQENNIGLTNYIGSLSHLLYGLQYHVSPEDKLVIGDLVCLLEYLYDESLSTDYPIEEIRREVFHCLDLIDKSFKAVKVDGLQLHR